MSEKTKKLVFCAAALSLAFVTSLIKLFSLPFGGTVTLFSMLFIVIAALWYGPVSGIILGIILGIFEFMIEPVFLSVPQFLLDYICSYGALGIAGFFYGNNNSKPKLIPGYITAILARGFFATLAGYIFWMDYMPDNFPESISFLYSIIYNYSYILAEGILTVIILCVPAVRKAIEKTKTP